MYVPLQLVCLGLGVAFLEYFKPKNASCPFITFIYCDLIVLHLRAKTKYYLLHGPIEHLNLHLTKIMELIASRLNVPLQLFCLDVALAEGFFLPKNASPPFRMDMFMVTVLHMRAQNSNVSCFFFQVRLT